MPETEGGRFLAPTSAGWASLAAHSLAAIYQGQGRAQASPQPAALTPRSVCRLLCLDAILPFCRALVGRREGPRLPGRGLRNKRRRARSAAAAFLPLLQPPKSS